jgi:HSP20 family protein
MKSIAQSLKRDEYSNAFLINEKRNRESLENQNHRLMDAIVKQKQGIIERFGKYGDTENDPFYKMQEFETRIAENENYYLVRTKVPKHERDNVDVIVKDNQLIVSGQRSFAEKVDKDNRKITTNSHQSFREIIPLKHPTVPKSVERSYEDGTIAVMIPKIPIK